MEKSDHAAGATASDLSATTPEPEKQQTSGFLAFLRIFTYCEPLDCVLEVIGLVAAIGSGVALSMMNLVIGQLMDVMSDPMRISTDPDGFMADVSKNALYFVYIGIARLVCTYIYSTLFTYVSFRVTNNIRKSYLRAALIQEISYFDHGTSGSISMQGVANGKLIQSGIADKLGLFFTSLATFIAAFIIAFVNYWKLTLILICIMPAIIFVIGAMATIDAGIDGHNLKILSQAAQYAETALANTRAIKAFNLESRVMHKYATFLDDSQRLCRKKCLIYGIMFGWQYFVIYAGMALAFWQGIRMIARQEVEGIGTVFTVLFSVVIGSTAINGIAPNISSFVRAAAGATELFALIDQDSDINPLNESGQRPSQVSGVISLESIRFSYPTRPDTQVLDDFSLNIPAGKVTALVGASGSGKSTIIGLLERWYNPTSGDIKLDGINIKDLNVNWLRTTMRLVEQEPVLFNGTIFDNIANGLAGTTLAASPRQDQEEAVRNAAKLAFADEFIQSLPDEYDTRIGERGGLLSGGQKQRIAIARSIVSNPSILLLDEATSALDPHSEGIVQQALDSASNNRTIVVIAHKLATIRHADNIVVMNKGKIVEQGRHDELVALGGTYAKLVQAQDLSATKQDLVNPNSDQESIATTEAVEPVQSITKSHATADDKVLSQIVREDFSLYKRTGLVHTILLLVQSSPELKTCYFITCVCCFLGAAVFPGQTLLLAEVMDVFQSPNLTKGGDFVSLMYFVLALGALVVFFILGWSSNIVAQTLSQKVRKGLLHGMLRQDLRFFDRPDNTVGALISRVDSHSQAVLELMGFNVALALQCIINVVASSILALVYAWKLGLVGVFAGMPPLLLAGYSRIRLETKLDTEVDSRFSTSASIASESVNGFTKANSAANYYFWLTNLQPLIRETEQTRDKGPASDCTSIDFQDVQFSYPLAPEKQVIKGLDLTIERGQFVAFVGASGCGKSTMISLLERFYDPISGSINIDGSASLTDISPRLYRGRLALVQQEPTLFPDSIRDNIVAGLDVSPAEQALVKDDVLEEACRAANAWDFISSLPEGPNTPCGQGGSQLSGGQRQRIAIARALIRSPKVLLLDEATSALDTESERVVQKALASAAADGNRITIAVAHRLSTIRDADKICVFLRGRIVESGTHDELIRQDGIYKQMCDAQRLDKAV
ncbi:hypothetical protein NW752_003229 [Fusarium irregulare]|nr:hypothetical protein NW752_003229 [Fusarium irregulare]